MTLMIFGVIGGLITSLVVIFAPKTSPIAAPIYAALEGLFLGGISAVFSYLYDGIVIKAVLLTFSILFAMLFIYKTGIIKVTEKFRLAITAAIGGIFMMYLVSWILGAIGIGVPFFHQGGWLGILISVGIIIVASLSLLLDFDGIEQGVANGAPK